jgi:uncharacterized protein YggE
MNLQTILALGLAVMPFASAFAQYEPKPQISVTGSAEIKVAPDEINISVGVETRDADLNVATRQNDERMARALAFLKSVDVPDKYVKTDYISVEPDYGPGNERTEPRFYIARKSIEIKLTNVTNLETVLTGLLNNGVNNIHNVDFRTTQLRKYRDEARAMATRAAKEKAEAMAKELGVKCGKPININANEYGGWWSGQRMDWRSRGGGFYGANNMQNISQNNGGPADSAGETLSIGQISISASVSVSFLID